MRLKILFISRNYPPRIGGLEAFSYNLIKEFEAHEITHKITLGKSYIHLFWFLPFALFKGFYLTKKHDIFLIHLCDGFLAPIGILLKLLTDARISITIHGLDITYDHRLYQLIVPWCVARLDKVICVSRFTQAECIRRGIPHHRCTVIPNGVRPDELYLNRFKNDLRRKLAKAAGISLQDKTVLVTVGRLVLRKGIAWFVETVMPRLRESFYYLIAGDGPEYRRIQRLVENKNLRDRVFLLGRVSEETKKIIYNAADIFVMPNLTVPNDVEGFGIAAIEAGSCGLPVIASDIQGLQDAVFDGVTGYLIGECDAEGLIQKIEQMDLKREDVRSAVVSGFDWKRVYKSYRNALIRMFYDQ